MAIVYNGNQFLFATQIKHTVFNGVPMDLIYVGMDIDEDEARKIFDGVYQCKLNSAPPKIEAIRYFLKPKWAITKCCSIDPSDYSDIFYWHSSWLFYFLYKYSVLHGHRYIWHLLPEGVGAYIDNTPEISTKKYGVFLFEQLFEIIDITLFDYPTMKRQIIEDVYMIRPDLSITDDTIKKVSVPSFDLSEFDYINNISLSLRYKHIIMENKIIILDGGCNCSRREFYDVKKMDELICLVGKKVGKENVILKRKHGVGIDQYDEKVITSVTLYEDEDIPWELICMNGGIKNSIIISVASSSVVLPYVFCGFNERTYRISNSFLQYSFDYDLYIKGEELNNRILGFFDNYGVIENLKDLETIINSYINNMNG